MMPTSRCWYSSTSSSKAPGSSARTRYIRRTSGSRKASCPLDSPMAVTNASHRAVRPLSMKPPPPSLVPVGPDLHEGSLARWGVERRAPQLATGGVDLGALALADLHTDPSLTQASDESVERFLGRPAVREALDVVKWYQVNVCMPATQQPRQLRGVGRFVVQSAQQHV